MQRCPVCGSKLDIVELSLTPRQREIRDQIELLEAAHGRPPSTVAIATRVNLAPTTIRPDLHQMEMLQVLSRPNGPKSGWSLRTNHVRLVRTA